MKFALAHDYLNQYGGAERVLEVLCEMFPEAPIYTLLYDAAKMGGRFNGRKIRASFLDFPFARRHHQLFIPVSPFAARSVKIPDEYDVIIIDSAAYAKGITVPSKAKVILYCHTPLRYAWEGEFIDAGVGLSGTPAKIFRAAVYPLAAYLRFFDRRAAARADIILANSNFIAEKIKKYYGRDASVVYPPIRTDFFSYDSNTPRGNYFLAAGRLQAYKKFDLIIRAFNHLGLPLKIAGAGPEEKYLKSISAKNIEFLGAVSDEVLREALRGARAFIMANAEDFGMLAAEAISCGTPVVAYGQGGALEIVEENKSGLFFREQTPASLAGAIHEAALKKWDHAAIAASAQKFSANNFKAKLALFIGKMVHYQ